MKRHIHFSDIICLCVCVLLILAVSLACDFLTPLQNKQYENSVGEIPLAMQTYRAGQNQVTHPAVISFEQPWNGYRYWMTYSPYPFANGEEENPCIAVSNDLYRWETPKGMVNPIADNEETGCSELKDPHLLYRDDLNRVEVWYLGRVSKQLGGDGTSLTLFRKYSYDGIVWSAYEIMTTTKYLSPSVRWDGTQYQLWGIGFDTYDTQNTFVYQQSKDGYQWSEPIPCSINGVSKELPLWHGSVVYYGDKGYYFTYIENKTGSQQVMCCHSEDGLSFSEPITVVKNTKQSLWQQLYRPFLLIEKGEYVLFYGVITYANEWQITISRGVSLLSLDGITKDDKPKMAAVSMPVTDVGALRYVARRIYHSCQTYFRLEIMVLLVPFSLLSWLFIRQKTCIKRRMCIFALISVCMCYSYIYIKFSPQGVMGVIPAVIMSLFEGVSLFSIAMILGYLCNYKTNGKNCDSSKPI